MAEFTDAVNENTADNTGFSDNAGDTPPSDAQVIPDTSDTTGTGETSSAPTDSLETESATPDTTQAPESLTEDSTGETVSQEQDIYILLQQLQTEQKEYETEVLKAAEMLTTQSKNLLSCGVLIVVLLGFLSGLVLARSVWRKL